MLQTFSASRFFACLKTTPPFENDSANITHHCALRQNSVSPQDRFLEARFSLFLRESVKVSCSPYPQKFTLSACAALRARQPPCSKCAHRKVRFSVAGIKLYLGAASRCRLRCAPRGTVVPLKVRSPKSAVFGGGKSHDRFLEARSASSNRSTTLYQTQKLTFKAIRTFAFSPQAFYPIYFNFYIYFFFYFFFYFYLEKKKGCGGEEEGGTQCFTRMISP